MNKWLAVALLLCAACLSAQTTSVTFQVLDTDGQTWNNGTWTVQLGMPPQSAQSNRFVILGTSTPVPNQSQSGTLDATGNGSLIVTPNTSIAPSGSVWIFNFCPQATPAACFQKSFSITGASQVLTVTPPGIRISVASPLTRATAYIDIEVTGAQLGSLYFNLISLNYKTCVTAILNNCTVWSTLGGGSVSVNGTIVASSNFNDALPAAPANGLNIKWQFSAPNISGYLLGDGNAAHCFSGIATFVPCSGGVSGLGIGQRVVPNTATTLANSGPTFYTEKLPGATWDARLSYCQTNVLALNNGPGYCDMSAETATASSTTAANGVIAGNGVIVKFPPVTLSFSNTFFINISGNNSGIMCEALFACVLDASNNGSAGITKLTGTNSFVTGFKMIGGRLLKQSGNENTITGVNDWFWQNWIVNAGQDAILMANNAGVSSELQASVRYNIIDQSGSAAILVNNSNNSTTTTLNDISFNLTRDANVNFLQNTQGTIGVGCSSSNCAAQTAHSADYNSFHDNIILNQFFGAGDCNNPNVAPVGSPNISGWSGDGAHIVLVNATPMIPGDLYTVGQTIVLSGFANALINGNQTITSRAIDGSTITFASTQTASTGNGNITYIPTSTDTGCSEGIQSTDPIWYSKIKNNHIVASSKEGIAFSGLGWQVTGNYCENCGLHSINSAFSGPFAFEKSSPVNPVPGYVGDGIFADNTGINNTSTVLRYCFQNLYSGTGSGPYTVQNVVIANNICDGSGGSGGFTSGITLNTSSLTGGNITLKNFRITGNTISGAVTTPFNPNGYAQITGVARLTGNGFNASTDAAPVSGHAVCFDTNLQPELDCGGPGTGTVSVVGAGNLTASALVTGGGSQLVQTPSAASTMDGSGNVSLAGSMTAATGITATAGGVTATAGGVTATAGGLNSTSDGVHAGLLSLIGNTTNPTSLPANSYGFIGSASAAFTSYFLQLSGTPGTSTPTLSCAAPGSNISPCTWSAVNATQANGTAIPASANILGTNSSAQLVTATAHDMALMRHCTDTSGSGSVQVCTTSPSFTVFNKDCIDYDTSTTNTGALTLNVNSSGAIAVQKWLGQALVAGDLPAFKTVVLCNDGTSHWQMMTTGLVTGTGAAVTAISPALTGSPTAPTQTAKDNSTKIATTAYVDAPTGLTASTSVTLTASRQYFVCTGTCTITVPVPVAGYEFCIMNDDNVATVITLSAIGSSARYENTARTAYGTAGTGTFVSGGAVGDKICLLGRDSTHYLTASFNGTWVAN